VISKIFQVSPVEESIKIFNFAIVLVSNNNSLLPESDQSENFLRPYRLIDVDQKVIVPIAWNSSEFSITPSHCNHTIWSSITQRWHCEAGFSFPFTSLQRWRCFSWPHSQFVSFNPISPLSYFQETEPISEKSGTVSLNTSRHLTIQRVSTKYFLKGSPTTLPNFDNDPISFSSPNQRILKISPDHWIFTMIRSTFQVLINGSSKKFRQITEFSHSSDHLLNRLPTDPWKVSTSISEFSFYL
jgi:hypothetical protein